MNRAVISLCLFGAISTIVYAEPIKLHPDNPHYLLWRNKPAILITSGEHYGAVLNTDFDYVKYFRTLQADGLNLTRTFSGVYCESTGAFNIKNNTLAPAANKFISPWARSDTPGYKNGGNKFDLTGYNPAYFERLKDFIAEADKHGVVVELVLFCPFYEDTMWVLSPMNAANNINGIGKMVRTDVYTLKDAKLQAAQDAVVRKIVTELKNFDNLYYEICNEPYFGGVTLDWQRHIAAVITETEKKLGVKHLIAQNIANKTQKIENPDPNISIFNFHYAKPPTAVTDNYHLNKVLGDDETGFAGSGDTVYRIEGWNFIMAGGGIYDNLDYSFQAGFEDGTGKIDAPGGGGPTFRKQMKTLKDFIHSFDFIHTRPDTSVIKSPLPEKASAYALVNKGDEYAIYISGWSGSLELKIDTPKGRYKIIWVDTKTGIIERTKTEHETGLLVLQSPEFTDDIALGIKAVK